jgi:hypothetical protein
MKRSFALALTIAAAVAVQIYIVSLPHEHPCPPPPLHDCQEVQLRARIAQLEGQVEILGPVAKIAIDHGTKLRTCEYKRWLQNGVHGE